MSRKEAAEEYLAALKEGQKEYKECIHKGLDPNPAVLDALLEQGYEFVTVDRIILAP